MKQGSKISASSGPSSKTSQSSFKYLISNEGSQKSEYDRALNGSGNKSQNFLFNSNNSNKQNNYWEQMISKQHPDITNKSQQSNSQIKQVLSDMMDIEEKSDYTESKIEPDLKVHKCNCYQFCYKERCNCYKAINQACVQGLCCGKCLQLKDNLLKPIGCRCKGPCGRKCICVAGDRLCVQQCECFNCMNMDEKKLKIQGLQQKSEMVQQSKQKITSKKTCVCKKSKCLKRYCNCYSSGIQCSKYCQCEECQNCSEEESNRRKELQSKKHVAPYVDRSLLGVKMNHEMKFQPFKFK